MVTAEHLSNLAFLLSEALPLLYRLDMHEASPAKRQERAEHIRELFFI